MKTPLQHLEEFAGSRNPKFVCRKSGRLETTDPEFVASVSHILNPQASSSDLKKLRSALGLHASQFEEVYSAHDGFILYKDRLSEAAGIEALPISAWKAATEELQESFEYLSEGDDPDQLLGGVAFATVPESGNYFVVPVQGPSAGKIFYADHDGWYDAPFSNGFAGFIRRVTNNPASLLCDELGCYTRYTDGRTTIQWIPTSYVVDDR